MKAPDKIYVCIPQRLNLSTFKEDSKYVGMAYNDKGNLRSSQIEEYIRKDALLKWANKKLQESADRLDFHANQAYTEVIDKLNSL
jgi:hypothetical protein